MARIARKRLPPGVWHVTTKGTGGTRIFADNEDRATFLRLLRIVERRFGLRIHAWCLMSTHLHLLIETSPRQISAGMHWLLGVYAQAFNRRHSRKGHLYEERFRAWVVRDEDHLSNAIRYVLDNPVRAGICARIEDWPWSGPRFVSDEAAVPRRRSPGHREKTRVRISRGAARRRTASERPLRRAASWGSRGTRTRIASRLRSPPCPRPR